MDLGFYMLLNYRFKPATPLYSDLLWRYIVNDNLSCEMAT